MLSTRFIIAFLGISFILFDLGITSRASAVPCMDENVNCRKHLCDVYSINMRQLICPVTCGTCRDRVQTTAPLPSAVPCMDENVNCRKHLCDVYSINMRQLICPVTCGTCRDRVQTTAPLRYFTTTALNTSPIALNTTTTTPITTKISSTTAATTTTNTSLLLLISWDEQHP
uniref:ShKT domain-containing protein n=1 Tax=Ciona intestinalis TaxID=7719 RepID=H2XQE3_CIOIN